MMGALAWQATVINKIFLCPGEEIARGLIFFAPGSPPPCVPVPVALCSSAAPLRYGTRASSISPPLQKIWSSSDTQGTIGNFSMYAISFVLCSSQRFNFVIS